MLLNSCTPALGSDGFLRSENSCISWLMVNLPYSICLGGKMFSLVLISFYFLKDLKGTLAQELDFVNEGKNSERCAEELKHFSFVVVPKVFWEQTSKVRLLSAVQNITGLPSFPRLKLFLRFSLRFKESVDGGVLQRLQNQQCGRN